MTQSSQPEAQITLPGGRFRLLRLMGSVGEASSDSVLWLTIAASVSRFVLIYAVNQAAMVFAAGGISLGLLLMLGAAAAAFLYLSYLSRYRGHVVIARIQRRLRLHLIRLLAKADSRVLQGKKKGDSYAALTSDVAEISVAVPHVILAAEGLLVACIAVPYIFAISSGAAVATVIAISIGALGFIVFDRQARQDAAAANKENAAFCNRVDDVLSGWRETRLSASRAADVDADAIHILQELETYRLRSEKQFAASTVVSQSALVLLMCFTVTLIPVIQGGGQETMFQVLTVVLLSYGPIEALFNALPRISVAETAYDRICSVEQEMASAQVDTAATQPAGVIFERLDLNAVISTIHDRHGEAFVLGPIDLHLSPGKVVFVTGGNGSGKTTLMSVLAGLRTPDSGRFVLNGGPASNVGMTQLFSSVFADFHLFDLSFGLTPDQIAVAESWIDRFELADEVSIIDGAFSTTALSAGRRRRLALAIALADDRPILLLDEFAADQDPKWRRLFYEQLLPEIAARGTLVIAITHDDHQFSKCDRLIRMENGQIVSDDENPGRSVV